MLAASRPIGLAAVTCWLGLGRQRSPAHLLASFPIHPSTHPPSGQPSKKERLEATSSHGLSHHLQHFSHRFSGDQIPAERSDQDLRWKEHQVQHGGYLPRQCPSGRNEEQIGQPQSHSSPDFQRGPLLRGLRTVCGSSGTEHPAAIPEVSLSLLLPCPAVKNLPPHMKNHPGLGNSAFQMDHLLSDCQLYARSTSSPTASELHSLFHCGLQRPARMQLGPFSSCLWGW